ncbi:ABC transporter permease [Brevibacillus laterosporus]|uniref:ABC transporter permease n=1 Tax=Brevibacillus laterosporus TaxID=1465 RepID=UPI0003728E2C|nr:ABC transporter permease [Brevibacillus laterosporus]ATO49839.1 sodium ABC transporter permease [Brevibacillus laterosporus DSM 25]MBG9801583.1 sodium ABC transporter permease [Brevibacillus laterosporus]MED2005029.1 ABC transporter permease [Brevibacillus laterosporus]MED4765389.1 ABC transporter permease [Brevibacillus laterosporus]TPH08311.1 ABC transporter permease [Brevibacillus laterosporus]
MNRQHIWIVFQKEMTDLIRDRKTWIGALVIPLVVVPLFVFLMSFSMNGVAKEAQSFVPLIVNADSQHPFVQILQKNDSVKMIQVEDPLVAIKNGNARAFIKLPEQLQSKLQAGEAVDITVWYDPSNQKSTYAKTLIEKSIKEYEREVVSKRLQHVGLSIEAIEPMHTNFESVASDEKVSGSILSGVLIILMIASLISGGLPAATDLIAGEKERGTLETLISAPITANSVLTAKLFTVMIMSGVSSLASVISVSLIFSFISMNHDAGGLSLQFFTTSSIIVLFVVLILLSAMFAGIMLSISSFAKSFKEAQTYMTPLVLVGLVPAYLMMPLNPIDIPYAYYMLPIFNGVAIFKEIFYGELQPMHALLVVFTSLCYVIIAIKVAAKFFKRENLLVK